jgi:hypothetical protein
MTVQKPAASATKAQIVDAFDELLERYETLEKEVKKLEKAAKAAPAPAASPAPAAVTQSAPALPPAMPLVKLESAKTPEIGGMHSMMSLLDTLQGGFGKTLAELSEKLSLEAETLRELREEMAKGKAELSSLYALEVAEDTLDTLLAEYETFEKSSRESFEARQKALEAARLEARVAWETEQDEHTRISQERATQTGLFDKREADEYAYALEQARKLDAEGYKVAQAALAEGLKDTAEGVRKVWDEKEKALLEREKAYREAREKVEAFPTEKETAVKRAEGEGRGIGSSQAKVRADLLAKELEGKRRIFEQRISGLQNSVNLQQSRIASLSSQLESASRQMQDLAVKAIEGSANVNSLQAFKDLAMEQAKAQGKTGR